MVTRNRLGPRLGLGVLSKLTVHVNQRNLDLVKDKNNKKYWNYTNFSCSVKNTVYRELKVNILQESTKTSPIIINRYYVVFTMTHEGYSLRGIQIQRKGTTEIETNERITFITLYTV